MNRVSRPVKDNAPPPGAPGANGSTVSAAR